MCEVCTRRFVCVCARHVALFSFDRAGVWCASVCVHLVFLKEEIAHQQTLWCPLVLPNKPCSSTGGPAARTVSANCWCSSGMIGSWVMVLGLSQVCHPHSHTTSEKGQLSSPTVHRSGNKGPELVTCPPAILPGPFSDLDSMSVCPGREAASVGCQSRVFQAPVSQAWH